MVICRKYNDKCLYCQAFDGSDFAFSLRIGNCSTSFKANFKLGLASKGLKAKSMGVLLFSTPNSRLILSKVYGSSQNFVVKDLSGF